MQIYEYKKSRYFVEHTLTNIFAGLIIIISIYNIVNGFLPVIMTVALISSLYSIINNFIFKVNAERVGIDKDTILFQAYNNTKKYQISEIKKIKLKEYPTIGKIYVRIYDRNNKLNRFWIHTNSFLNGKKLFIHLLYVEYNKHPDTLKASSQSEEFFNLILQTNC